MQTKVVADLIVVAEKSSEVEYEAYVRIQKRAHMKYQITLDQERHYVVKSIECVDASKGIFETKNKGAIVRKELLRRE